MHIPPQYNIIMVTRFIILAQDNQIFKGLIAHIASYSRNHKIYIHCEEGHKRYPLAFQNNAKNLSHIIYNRR